VGGVLFGGHPGLSDHEMTKFSILGEVERGASKTTTMDFQREDFGLFRILVERVTWERLLKGKVVQTGWTFFKKEVLKATQQAASMCHKTNQQGRLPAFLNRELLLGLRKKRRVYHFCKKGQVTHKEYRVLVRSCREEIRKAKAQLELILGTVVKHRKKCLYKYFNNQKRSKENLHPLLDSGVNIVTKDKENAEILSAFFASVFNSQTGYSQDTQPPVLEDRDGEQNKPPITQEEAVNDLLCHLDTYKVYGTGWDPPESAEGAGGGAGQATLHNLSAVLANRGGPRQLEDRQCNTHLQEGPEGGSREPQACQPDLGAGQDSGVILPECAHWACEGQPEDQAQPAWLHERQVLLDQPDLLL